jgi:hypothetical protein
LAVTPTECAIPAFKEVKESLICSKSYENYQLNLDFAEKHFFESMAAEQSFNNNHHYINFINSLFPQEDRRLYQLAYSGIPLDKIDKFFEMLRKGVKTGKGWKEERERSDGTANFAVGLVPTGDKDVCFQITVGRRDGMESLGECRFAQIKL